MKTPAPSAIKNINRSKLLENLSWLIGWQDMTYAELEKAAGVYGGYISRMKADPRKLPALDALYRMSQVLGVPLEWLIEGSPGNLDENVLYVRRFVQRLFDLSLQHSIFWHTIPFAFLLAWGSRDCVSPDVLPFVARGPDGNYHPVSQAFPGVDCSFADSAFVVPLDQDRSVLMVSLRFSEKADDEKSSDTINSKWLELQILDQKTGGRSMVACSAYGGNDLIWADLEKLYRQLKELETSLPLDPPLRGVIDSFMQHTNGPRHPVADMPRHLL